MALATLAPGYVPRLGERSVLHEAVRENVETFLARARERTEHGFGVPRFVEDELRGFLKCGVLAHGFIRVRCGACGDELLRDSDWGAQVFGDLSVSLVVAWTLLVPLARSRGVPALPYVIATPFVGSPALLLCLIHVELRRRSPPHAA